MGPSTSNQTGDPPVFVALHNPLHRILAALAAVAVAGIIYFAFVTPRQNAATKTVNQSAQRTQQSVSAVRRGKEAGAARAASVNNLKNCLAAAHGNSAAESACTAEFHPFPG